MKIRDISLVDIGDIENLIQTGRQHKACQDLLFLTSLFTFFTDLLFTTHF